MDCIKCGNLLQAGINTVNSATRRHFTCKSCANERGRRWYQNNKERAIEQSHRKRANMTPEQREKVRLRTQQGNKARQARKVIERAAMSPQQKHDARLVIKPQTRKQSPEHIAKRTTAVKERLSKEAIKCIGCGDDFIRTRAAQTYCSGRCWDRKERRRKAAKPPRMQVSPTFYAQLVSTYGNACNICGAASGGNSRGDRLAVDHDHATGMIRGLLCHRCNTAIGLLRDNRGLLEQAAKYLFARSA